MSTTYDVLGDPGEYEEWLESQQPPEPATEHKQQNVAQQIQDLPEKIVQVISHLDEQHASAILSAYKRLQLSRYIVTPAVCSHLFETPLVLTLVRSFTDQMTSCQSRVLKAQSYLTG